MNIKFPKIGSLVLLAALIAFPAFSQQNTITATTTSAVQAITDRVLVVTSATGINAPVPGAVGTQLYVVDVGQTVGEIENVLSVSGTTITVTRSSSKAVPHASGAMVLIGNPQWFNKYNPVGSCVTATIYASPWVNTTTGEQWFCSSQTLTWVPGWGTFSGLPPQVITGTATASVAGPTAIAAPLLHISGTNAITQFNMSAGWNGQGFCVVPDAAFTTTATNNIAIASTAVLNKTLCFTWDAKNSKFTASY